jgi:hypothetical protein
MIYDPDANQWIQPTMIGAQHDATDSDHVVECDPCWNEAAKEHYEAEALRDQPSPEEEMAMALAVPCSYCGAGEGESCNPDCLGGVE